MSNILKNTQKEEIWTNNWGGVKEDRVWHWIIDASKILETAELVVSRNTLWGTKLVREKGTRWDVHDRYKIEMAKRKDEVERCTAPRGD